MALGGSGRSCPNCGDDERWLAEVRRMGVYVPEPSNASTFEEMIGSSESGSPEEERGCTAKICFSDQESGRCHVDQGSWRLVDCQDCGSRPIHAACGGLEDPRVSWRCYTCRNLNSVERREPKEGVLWEAREQLLAASFLSSQSLKHTSSPPRQSAATEPLRRITAETSFTDLLGCMLDSGEGEASPGDSDYESSSQETRTFADRHRPMLESSKGILDLRKTPLSSCTSKTVEARLRQLT